MISLQNSSYQEIGNIGLKKAYQLETHNYTYS